MCVSCFPSSLVRINVLLSANAKKMRVQENRRKETTTFAARIRNNVHEILHSLRCSASHKASTMDAKSENNIWMTKEWEAKKVFLFHLLVFIFAGHSPQTPPRTMCERYKMPTEVRKSKSAFSLPRYRHLTNESKKFLTTFPSQTPKSGKSRRYANGVAAREREWVFMATAWHTTKLNPLR